MQELRVKNSRICIGESYLELDKYLPKKKVVIVTDENVYGHYKDFIQSYEHIVISAGEAAKDIKTITYIVEELLAKGADRSTFLIGMGGGVVTDITGFVASVFMRGVRFGFVATSLLAQVDASLGGKNGINFQHYKNMLGVFNVPEFVLCDPILFKTLPEREIRSGFAEVIKHALIKDYNLFTYLETHSKALLDLDADCLEEVITRAIQIKAEVVENDWKERGERKQLNFGHTLGHAIESNTGLIHGEAIAVGMCWAADWSAKRGYLAYQEVQRVKTLIKNYELPIACEIDSDLCIRFMRKDKKKENDQIDFVFLEEVGKARLELVKLDTLFKELKN